MAYRLATATRNAAADANVDLLDGGTIEVRTGAQPAAVNDADSGTLLGTLTFGTPAFGAASGGEATAEAITSDTDADASGDAGHVRIKTSAAAIHSDALAGESGDSPDVEFDNKSVVAGGTIAISSMTITQPI
jgi:hypothetical protein